MKEQKVRTAIETLEKFKQHEGDNAHKKDLEKVKQMVRGVYEEYDEPPTEEELLILEQVLEEIDSEEQWWHDKEEVEELVRIGNEFVEMGKNFSNNPKIWNK
jgi:hypothetical protein